jgi:hypothetical protein
MERRTMQDADRISPAVDFEDYRALREFNEPDAPVDEEDDDFEDGEDEPANFAREPARNQRSRQRGG